MTDQMVNEIIKNRINAFFTDKIVNITEVVPILFLSIILLTVIILAINLAFECNDNCWLITAESKEIMYKARIQQLLALTGASLYYVIPVAILTVIFSLFVNIGTALSAACLLIGAIMFPIAVFQNILMIRT